MAETDFGSEDRIAAVAPAACPASPATGTGRLPGRGLRRVAGAVVIAVPAATTFAVGGYEIGGPSLWRDEAYTKDAINRSAGQLFAMLGHQDAVHGAYYLLLHLVAGAIGTSAAALRFPSLCAMVVAAGVTAAIGRRTATLAQQPQARDAGWGMPALTGLLAGMIFATAPLMTYYAQMARSYAIVTMLAAVATYLLLRAYPDGRWRWWAGYGAAVALTGLLNLFALLILAAHGVTLLLTDRRRLPGGAAPAGRAIGRLPARWLAVSAAAVVVLGPLLWLGYRQSGQISWLAKPDYHTLTALAGDFAGSKDLVVPFALLALAGVAAARLADDWRPLNPAAVALPWTVVPAVILLAVSLVKPVYDERYVEFCLPGMAVLVAAGLAGLARLGSAAALRRRNLAWLPAAAAGLVVAGLAAGLIGPQGAIRQTAARPDNLRLASAIVAAREQPGDAVFYMPSDMQVLGTGYPAPFERLRNIARAEGPIASATLTGTQITSPAVLKSRFTGFRRVWVVTGASDRKFPVPATPVDKEMIALIAGAGMRVIGRWQAGEVMLTLFGR